MIKENIDYQLIKTVVSPEDFVRLRKVSGLTPRELLAAKKALPNSLFGVHIVVDSKTIAMGRVVGDGALNFEVVDVAVEPKFQGQGYGQLIMSAIMEYLDHHAMKSAYITLMADVPALYQKFGFKFSRPHSEGMYMVK
ncbi:GNAT family N-acetyltransferase [Thalassotalea ganghwensis]